MYVLAQLNHQEQAGLDCGRLEEILLTHGERGAERFLGRTLEDVAVRLARVERAWHRGETCSVRRTARALSEASGQIGLTTLSRVALDVSQVSGRNDQAALAATVCRLGRVGEASLMRIWDIRDESV